MKRFISALIVLLLVFPIVSFTSKLNVPAYAIKTIVIDPGHGGRHHDTTGKISREQDVTLKVSMLLGKAIQESMKDVKVIYTRTADVDLSSIRDVDLRERIAIANRASADLFISIHCNAMTAEKSVAYKATVKGKRMTRYGTVEVKVPTAKGVETFVAGSARLDEQKKAIGEYAKLKEDYKENAKYDSKDPKIAIAISLMSNDLRKKSIQLATHIQEQYVSTGRLDRGVQELSLAVLRTASMPCVLTEIGFLTNPEEENYLNSVEGQTEVVNCLLKAIQSYKKVVEFE
jgi:N-acetylmuramoyl-L-alanine amidase